MRRALFEDLHEDFRASFRTFLQREIAPRYELWEREGLIPREVFATAGGGGFLAMAAPERFGGAGAEDFRLNLVIGEECQRAGLGSFGLGITLHNDISLPYFLSYCTPEQQQRWLPGIVSGELITAIAMTEPGIGSDLAGMSTTARRENGHYIVNGAKTFITNGINADLIITAVKTDASARHRGISLLVIERGMEGFSRGRNLEKIGQHAQDTAELGFDDVRVPAENLLGEPRRGVRLPRLEPPPGATVDRGERGRGGGGDARLDARVREGAQGVRADDRLVPELAVHARGGARRNPDRAHVRRPLRARRSTRAS